MPRACRPLLAAVTVVLSLGATHAASAQAPTGVVNINGMAGFGRQSLDFRLPIAGGTGSFGVQVTGNTGTFAGLGGTSGTIRDLDFLTQRSGTPLTLANFVSFAMLPELQFDLTFFAPGPYPSTACDAVPTSGQVCTPAAFSGGVANPYGFLNLTASTSVLTLAFEGTARNTATGESSVWHGDLTTQFSSESYQQLRQRWSAGETIEATYALSLTARSASTTIPEPHTWTLLGLGLATLGGVAVRRRRA